MVIQNAHSIFVVLFLILSTGAARGSQPAFDSAADSAYNNGWSQGSNGGFGYGEGWSFAASSSPILGSSTTNGSGDANGDGDINTPRAIAGRAWGLPSGTATRTFSGPLVGGQTFSIDYDDYGGGSPNYSSSIYLLAPDGSIALHVDSNRIGTAGGLQYVVFTSTAELDSGVSDTNEGIHLGFLVAPTGVEVSLTPYLAGTATTTIDVPYSGQIESFEFLADGGPSVPMAAWPYINNIAITPEPGSAALWVLAGGGPLLRRRRRRLPSGRQW